MSSDEALRKSWLSTLVKNVRDKIPEDAHMSDLSQQLREGPADSALAFRAADEIERLTEAKRRALQLADQRAKEANELRQQLVQARCVAIEECAKVAETLAMEYPRFTAGRIVGASCAVRIRFLLTDEKRDGLGSRLKSGCGWCGSDKPCGASECGYHRQALPALTSALEKTDD